MVDLSFGFEVMLIGFAGVFVALSILYVLLVLMDRFFSKKRSKPAKPQPLAAGEIKPSAPQKPETSGDEGERDELMAVITAALSVYLQKPRPNLAIRSITPVGNTNSWVYYGRTRNMDLKNSVSSKRREKRI